LPTRMIIGLSVFVPKYWWILILGTGLIIFGYKKFKTSKFGKNILDQAVLYMPVIRDLMKNVVVCRFIKVMSALVGSGVPIMQALDVAKQVANNTVMDKIIEDIRDNVNAGGGIKDPISKADIFPQMVVQMIGIGEEIGSMGESMDKSSKFLDRDIDDQVKRLITKIEPITTVAVAGVVGLIMMAIYLPMFDVVKLAG
jgi:type IV pilus assembly protein PilC